MKRLGVTGLLAALALAGCGSADDGAEGASAAAAQGTPDATAGASPAAGEGNRATATLQTAQGAPAGTATASEADGGVMITVRAEGVPTGAHGVHVHMTGRCDPPKFESAGGHWNPTEAKHGLEGDPGQHAGDMPNMAVDASGRGTLDYRLEGGSFAQLLDSDGAAFVIHAKADDQKTDPSGNSGDRIACGVFKAG